MNIKLLDQIVRNVFSNLLIIKSDFINIETSKALNSKDFLLREKIDFDTDEGVISNKIWGCQISTGDQEIKLLLGDCSQDDVAEYCLIVQLKNTPTYGVYLIDTESSSKNTGDALIACNLNENNWMICNTYLQATFLAGMEQIKELSFSWNKCFDYSNGIDKMKSFIKYHQENYQYCID